MKTVTVVTLYDGGQADHFVGVVAGEVDQAGKEALCKAYDALEEEPENEQEADAFYEKGGRLLYFAVVEMVDSPLEMKHVMNIFGDGFGSVTSEA